MSEEPARLTIRKAKSQKKDVHTFVLLEFRTIKTSGIFAI